jgi:hypothetical protein
VAKEKRNFPEIAKTTRGGITIIRLRTGLILHITTELQKKSKKMANPYLTDYKNIYSK